MTWNMLWQKFQIDTPVAIAMLVMAAVVDIFTLVLNLNRNIKGRGPSGIPLVSLLLYLCAAGLSREPVPFNGHPFVFFRILNLSLLTYFHFLCQYLIPRWHGRLM
jgi:hypothetical protein